MPQCKTVEIAIEVTRDIILSRNAYKDALAHCAAIVDAIRKYDATERAKAQEAARGG